MEYLYIPTLATSHRFTQFHFHNGANTGTITVSIL